MLCLNCGKELKANRRKYCSRKCNSEYRYKNNKESINRNNYYKQSIKAINRKLTLIGYRGGCCENCGYKNNLSALEFHHIDSIDKLFELNGRYLANTKWDKILLEFNKCLVLCSNCHKEKHNPEMGIYDLNLSIKEKCDELNLINDLLIKIDNLCVDCNKKINKKSIRCRACNGVKKQKVSKPTYKQLIKEIGKLGFVGTGKKYGVSDNAIRKWVKKYEN